MSKQETNNTPESGRIGIPASLKRGQTYNLLAAAFLVLGSAIGVQITEAALATGTLSEEIGVPIGKTPGPNPQQTGRIEFTLTVTDKNGNQVNGNIKIADIPKWPAPGKTIPPPPRKCEDYVDLITSRAEFQRGKAKKIADAINSNPDIKKAYGTFNPAKEVTVVEYKNAEDPYIRVLGGANIYKNCKAVGKELPEGDWAKIYIPSVSEQLGKKAAVFTLNTLGEGGDGGRFTPSSGTSGAMGRAVPGFTAVATGYDELGDPSIVEFGVKERYVASLTPTPGMTDLDILLALESSLNRNGIPESFDSQSLTLNIGVPRGKTLAWGNTDPGLDFRTGQGTVQFPQCPPIGSNTGCGILITVNSDNSVAVLVDSTQGGFDPGHDNVLVGVENHSAKPVLGLKLSGPYIFAFDNDGMCSTSISPRPSSCPFGPTTYEGPGTGFAIGNTDNGSVNFLHGGIRPGESAYFSLENSPVAAAVE